MTALMERTTQIIAYEINSTKEQTRKLVLNSSIEIGSKLAEAKKLVAHGEWTKWLKDNVDYSQSTATNLINIFEEFGTHQFVLFGENSNSQTFANLSYSQAVALLGVPSEEREGFVVDNKVEDMTARELAQAIKDKKVLEKQLEDSKKLAEDEKLANDELIFINAELEGKNKEHDDTLAKLNAELETAKSAGESSTAKKLKGDLDKIKDEKDKLAKKVKELEKQLKEKPIDVAATIEVIPPATQIELDTLRKAKEDHAAEIQKNNDEAAKQIAAMQEQLTKNNNTASIKVKVTLSTMVDNFKALLAAVEEVSIPEEKAKFKADIPTLFERLKAMVV